MWPDLKNCLLNNSENKRSVSEVVEALGSVGREFCGEISMLEFTMLINLNNHRLRLKGKSTVRNFIMDNM